LATALLEPDQTALLTSVSVEGIAADPENVIKRRKPPGKGRGRRGRDKRRKTLSKGITAPERKNIAGADSFARERGRPLNTTLDFQPYHLTTYPAGDLDVFFQGLRTRISTWCGRKKVGCFWVWMRENYVGSRREHLHVVMYLPARFRAELEAYIRRLYPGTEQLIAIGERTTEYDPETGRWTDGLAYRMKQLRGDAVGKPGPTRLPRQVRSRYDEAPVAPVHGKRCGVSDSLTLKSEQNWRAGRGLRRGAVS
jgi:hypothetical protein